MAMRIEREAMTRPDERDAAVASVPAAGSAIRASSGGAWRLSIDLVAHPERA